MFFSGAVGNLTGYVCISSVEPGMDEIPRGPVPCLSKLVIPAGEIVKPRNVVAYVENTHSSFFLTIG